MRNCPVRDFLSFDNGIRDAVAKMNSATLFESTQPFPRLLQRDAWLWEGSRCGPSNDDVDLGMAQLRRYLGQQRFQWLVACAILPMIAWPSTIFLGREVMEIRHEQTDSAAIESGLADGITMLKTLPWFMTGAMPAWLRKALLAQQTPGLADQLRPRLVAYLENIVQKDGEFPRRTLLQLIRARQDVFCDEVLVQFLEAELALAFVRKLPTTVKQWLFVGGSPLFGLRGTYRTAQT